jgi:hypothetical protein
MSICVATPAGAVGNDQLSKQIISNPVPGYQPVPASGLQSEVNYLNQLEESAIGPMGGKASVAVSGWRGPSNKVGVAIFLIAFSYPHANDHELQGNSASAGLSFCAAAAEPPASNTPIPGVPDSHLFLCPKLPSGEQSMVATWVKANVLGMVVTSPAVMSANKLTRIAGEQYNAMSSANTQIGGGSNTILKIGLVAGGVVLAGVIVAVLLVMRARKRREARVPLVLSSEPKLGGSVVPLGVSVNGVEGLDQERPAAGWYEDPANSEGRRYWTGSAWGPAGGHTTPTSQTSASPQEGDTES